MGQANSIKHWIFYNFFDQLLISLLSSWGVLSPIREACQYFIFYDVADVNTAHVFFIESAQSIVLWLIEVVRYFSQKLRKLINDGRALIFVTWYFSLFLVLPFSDIFLPLLDLRMTWWFLTLLCLRDILLLLEWWVFSRIFHFKNVYKSTIVYFALIVCKQHETNFINSS